MVSNPTPTSKFELPVLSSYTLSFSFIPAELNLMNGSEYAGEATNTATDASKAVITFPTNNLFTILLP